MGLVELKTFDMLKGEIIKDNPETLAKLRELYYDCHRYIEDLRPMALSRYNRRILQAQEIKLESVTERIQRYL